VTTSSTPAGAWHYTNSKGLLGIITNNVLWASSAAFMNDEQELIKGQTLIGDKIKNSSNLSDQEDQHVRDLLHLIEDPERQDFILSASESSDSLTLWRNYGREAVSYAVCLDKGVSLAPLVKKQYVETKDFPFADDDYYAPFLDGAYLPNGETETFLVDNPDNHVFMHNRTWEKVIYDFQHQLEITDKIIRDYIEAQSHGINTNRLEDLIGLTKSRIRRELSLIKDQGFADECEIRRHYSFVQPRWKFVDYRASTLGITPYVSLTTKNADASLEGEFGAFDEYETKAHPLPVLAVRIGPCRYPELAKTALRSFLDEHGYSKTQILKSEVPFR